MNSGNPKFSKTWEDPCLTRTNSDGTKTEWFERDLNEQSLSTMASLLDCIKQQNDLNEKFDIAQVIVQSMSTLNKNQELLFEKLLEQCQGKSVVLGEGEMTLTKPEEVKN
jgi:hypothetical protein